MSFQAFECEAPMPCGETCVRLFGHKEDHECEGDQAVRIGQLLLAGRYEEQRLADDRAFQALIDQREEE